METSTLMKISKYVALGLLVVSLTPVFGQPAGTVVLSDALNQQSQPPALTKFNLDFPGGTPAELITAIEKAMGKPLNAIIPDEFANEQLPPLKMSNVDVPRLFQALKLASVKGVQYVTSTGFGGGGFGVGSAWSTYMSGYGFKTEDPKTDDSVWYFFEDKPPQLSPEKTCRFYQLSPYLDRGLTVDDITTAIQTGWKMEGETSPPEISFHKETKLLIAVGEPGKLEVIDNVLKALQPPPPNPTAVFQERLQQVIKNQSQFSVPPAHPPLSPEDQVNLIEQTRKNNQQLPPAVLPPPPLKPEAGQ
jgi:hypothetical protein